MIGDERVMLRDGVEQTVFTTYDAHGNDVIELLSGSGIEVEGYDVMGYVRTTVARTANYLPARVVGMEVRRGTAAAVLELAMGSAWDEGGEEGGRYELGFSYHDNGLLATLTETYTEEFDVEKTRQRPVYSEAGEIVGQIVERLADSTGNIEEFSVKEVQMYERHDDRLRIIAYTHCRDCLVPSVVRDKYKDHRTPDTVYMPAFFMEDAADTYYRLTNPHHTDMLPYDTTDGEAAGIIAMPSFLPLASAEDVAARRLSLQDAAVVPEWSEATVLRRFISREQAASEAISPLSDRGYAEIINDLADRRVIVRHGMPDASWALLTVGLAYKIAFPGVQQLAMLASLHPALVREEAAPREVARLEIDTKLTDMVLRVLQLSREEARETLDEYRHLLSDRAVDALRYLLADRS